MTVLCTCGVRFIGGNFEDLVSPQSDALHVFLQDHIADSRLLDQLLGRGQPLAVLQLPAQSNVDRLSRPAHLHRRQVIELVGRSVDSSNIITSG